MGFNMKEESAFPRPASRGNNYLTGEEDVVVDPQRGMTLRDYFAAQAIIAYHADGEFSDSEDVASWCYRLADAMLKARKK
jgi:hypothetical protein